jgi:VanZ family protein
VAAVLYAATDELHQSLVPSRYARVTDVAIDAAGAAIGVVMGTRWRTTN